MIRPNKTKLAVRRITLRNLSTAEIRIALGGQWKLSELGECSTSTTSGNPGTCQSAFVTDCC